MAQLPTYGYRRIWALLRGSREQTGAPCVNAKRVHRVNLPDHLFVCRGMRHNFSRHRFVRPTRGCQRALDLARHNQIQGRVMIIDLPKPQIFAIPRRQCEVRGAR